MPRKKAKTSRRSPSLDEEIGAPPSERELIKNLDEDLADAWVKLREFAAGQGEQRIYTSATAIMFARRIVYLFVRPKKSYLQVNLILPRLIESELIKRGNRVTESRAVNTFRLVHSDQLDEPLTDWIRDAFEFTK